MKLNKYIDKLNQVVKENPELGNEDVSNLLISTGYFSDKNEETIFIGKTSGCHNEHCEFEKERYGKCRCEIFF